MPSYLSEKWLSSAVIVVTNNTVIGYPSKNATQEHCSFIGICIVSI
jgi:hypothetical protein